MLWTQNNSAYIIVNWTLKLGQQQGWYYQMLDCNAYILGWQHLTTLFSYASGNA